MGSRARVVIYRDAAVFAQRRISGGERYRYQCPFLEDPRRHGWIRPEVLVRTHARRGLGSTGI
eukprot:3638585-Pyramimonas_sp.AAC.1